MRIGIEGQRLFRVKKHGMDMVALELIRNLQTLDRKNEYFLFIKPDEDSNAVTETANFKIVQVPGGPYPVWEQRYLPRAVKETSCDLLHCTSNTAPLHLPVPLVVTLHDIIYLESSSLKLLTGGGTAYQRFGNLYRKWNVPRVIRESDRIITVSNFEKDRIAGFFNISSERLRAVYNGVSTHFVPNTNEKEIEEIRNRYRLPEHYVFFLGNTVQKKNTPGTLKAFALFRASTGLDVSLVMLDFESSDLTAILKQIDEPELAGHIHLTGYVPNDELPVIYQCAEAFLYPSFRESFGIPILEAQKCGTPVITSNTSSMPEIAGDGAHLVDPYRPEEIRDGMIRIFQDPDYRDELVKKGFVNAKKFSWNEMARQVLKIYRELGAL